MKEKSSEMLDEITTEATEKIAKEVYGDVVQPAAKEVGSFFGTLAGFFSKVVVYPLKKLNILYEQKARAFEREMQEKYNNIPENNRCEPRLSVVGPAMEALKYNMLEDHLRELFKNLLVNSMDNRKNGSISPAFIKIIEQMSEKDAALFKDLATSPAILFGQIYVVHLVMRDKSTGGNMLGVLPQYCCPNIDDMGIDEAALTISNLVRLGLIELEKIPNNDDLKVSILFNFLKLDDYADWLKKVRDDHDDLELEYDVETIYKINVTDLGRSFAFVCIEDMGEYEE